MKNISLWILLLYLFHTQIQAQEIAILDQGFNTTVQNDGLFYNPYCENYGGPDRVFGTTNSPLPNTTSPFDMPTTSIGQARYIWIKSLTLCQNLGNEARVPRLISYPENNILNDPYLGVRMLANETNISGYGFPLPFGTQAFGANLKHGSEVASAAYDFNPTIRRKMVQIYHIESAPPPRTNCSATPPAPTISANRARIGSGSTLAENVISSFLNDIIDDPDGVDAVNISIVFRQPFCSRQQGNLLPVACRDDTGQDEVNALKSMGIPVVVGLNNVDIANNEYTWPACLDNVIKVGASNDNQDVSVNGQIGGIGIGANGIDFYAKNSNPINSNGPGNSMAAPRVAAAYALLKDAVPQSTIPQRTLALENASSSKNEYKGANRRRNIKKSHMSKAITLLKNSVNGVLENIAYIDNGSYGSFYDDNSSNVLFNLNFDTLLVNNKFTSDPETTQQQSSLKPGSFPDKRDIVLSFEGRTSSSLSNGFSVYVNNSIVHHTLNFTGDNSFEITIRRSRFSEGENTIRIDPSNPSREWGLTNIKAEFTPTVVLSLGQVDGSVYGSNETPERPTGLRVSFDVNSLDDDISFAITGAKITDPTEMAIFFNGLPYGFLSQDIGPFGANDGDLFILNKEDLVDGTNTIELVQKDGATLEWSVRNLLVFTQDEDSPTLVLENTNTSEFGSNYGTNNHRFELDLNISPLTENDHQLSWRAYDIDQPGDVDVYLNNVRIKSIQTTANNSVGVIESITLASRLFQTGINTLSFKAKVNASDETWGITDVLVKPAKTINLENPSSLNLDYGYYTQYTGDVPLGWKRLYSDEDYQTRLYATFNSDGVQDKSISFRGWDIDSPDELSIYLNGDFHSFANSAPASSLYSATNTLRFSSSELTLGINTLSFRIDETITPGFQAEKWGIVFDRIKDIDPNKGKYVLPAILFILDEEQTPP